MHESYLHLGVFIPQDIQLIVIDILDMQIIFILESACMCALFVDVAV